MTKCPFPLIHFDANFPGKHIHTTVVYHRHTSFMDARGCFNCTPSSSSSSPSTSCHLHEMNIFNGLLFIRILWNRKNARMNVFVRTVAMQTIRLRSICCHRNQLSNGDWQRHSLMEFIHSDGFASHFALEMIFNVGYANEWIMQNENWRQNQP